MKSGLLKINPDGKDYSLVHTFGAIIPDPKSLPADFSIYGGQTIPNQELPDDRFTPPLPALPYGCTGEGGSFETGNQDGTLDNPQDLYLATPPGDQGGRDIREMLQVLIDRGVKESDGSMSQHRTAYFNCYGSGVITDADAARIALYINQNEKRGVIVGSYWYPEFNSPIDGKLPVPTFKTTTASMHCYLILGWRTNVDGTIDFQVLSWQGMNYGIAGVCWMPEVVYNALMAQPFTGAFTVTKTGSMTPIPIGFQAYIDHLVYFVKNLFKV